MFATRATTAASHLIPICSHRQLLEAGAPYIVGGGAMATELLRQMPRDLRRAVRIVDTDEVAGQSPDGVLGFRAFCATVSRECPVVYASEDNRLLRGLISVGQARIFDARDFVRSVRFVSQKAKCSVRRPMAVIGTIPRSGTFRINSFLFALNERLGNSATAISAHKLYLYHVSGWRSPGSPYRISRTFSAFKAVDVRVGHHLPPGSLALVGQNAYLATLFEGRTSRYLEGCRRHPALAEISHTMRPRLFEPVHSAERPAGVRYALVAREVVNQLVSVLTLYESLLSKCRERVSRRGSLNAYVLHCHERLRAFALFSFDGHIPLMLQQAVARDITFVDVVLSNGYLESAIVDYAIQLYCAARVERQMGQDLCGRVFSYERMVENERRFFLDFVEYFRGEALSESEGRTVEMAVQDTNHAAIQMIERELGHSLSYRPGLERVYEMRSHLTSGNATFPEIQARREGVAARVQGVAEWIRTRLANVLSNLHASEPQNSSREVI